MRNVRNNFFNSFNVGRETITISTELNNDRSETWIEEKEIEEKEIEVDRRERSVRYCVREEGKYNRTGKEKDRKGKTTKERKENGEREREGKRERETERQRNRNSVCVRER